jgi:hypothetical protein
MLLFSSSPFASQIDLHEVLTLLVHLLVFQESFAPSSPQVTELALELTELIQAGTFCSIKPRVFVPFHCQE